MKIYNNHEYRKVSKIEFNNKRFQIFLDDYNKLAVLEINKDNVLIYPDIKDVFSIAKIIYTKPVSMSALIDSGRKAKKYRFIPKVITRGGVVLLTVGLLKSCIDTNKPAVDGIDATVKETQGVEIPPYNPNPNTGNTQINTPAVPKVDSPSPQVEVSVPTSKPAREVTAEIRSYDETIYRDITDNYICYLSVADDEYDYNWMYDYEDSSYELFATDSKNYPEIFGFNKPTKDELLVALNNNPYIDAELKGIITNFIDKWLELWPDSDLSVFKHNLETLKIEKVDPATIEKIAGSSTSVACYNFDRNTIYLNTSSNYTNKTSSDYTILIHELIHAARNSIFRKDGHRVYVAYIKNKDLSLYTEEALTNVFALKITNADYNTYTLQTNYFNIITDAIGYTGADYMNHSYNYLFEKMDNYMGDEEYAYHISSLVGIQGALHYNQSIATTKYDNFIELYEYVIKMYCKSHFNDNASYDEVIDGYDDFWNKLAIKLGSYYPYTDVNIDYLYAVYENYAANTYSMSRTK